MSHGAELFRELETASPGTTVQLPHLLENMKWNDLGLVPAIAQQHDSGEVLMMAWMNEATLHETLSTGRVCYWSRSRNRPWRKGESSGQQQRLIEMRLDCDGDTLLLLVDQQGAACHTGRRSCFYTRLTHEKGEVVDAPLVDPEILYGNSK
ncbi:phosphoribosyl-AMP cyclohydrolase [Kushneria phosphatilytica]|uniref:Phosphoribosyl-AMP cyclohydrolase n=1 Tax=Kushneria phosphatilytica TaxID=657387 RepID=A0A1S1NVD3_9GAMM|nr:phosphoribosyl-AMP cyclohydrolase [Kushneria phosphatilytica]OHV11921.1 phosphoribosyl-AMP cyclohydrolase [Kushneria phosphatilytica]QEL11103.1 phosphoribosyl-AMP cyclohydrolase [Kushneria phosphatilytica]